MMMMVDDDYNNYSDNYNEGNNGSGNANNDSEILVIINIIVIIETLVCKNLVVSPISEGGQIHLNPVKIFFYADTPL